MTSTARACSHLSRNKFSLFVTTVADIGTSFRINLTPAVFQGANRFRACLVKRPFRKKRRLSMSLSHKTTTTPTGFGVLDNLEYTVCGGRTKSKRTFNFTTSLAGSSHSLVSQLKALVKDHPHPSGRSRTPCGRESTLPEGHSRRITDTTQARDDTST